MKSLNYSSLDLALRVYPVVKEAKERNRDHKQRTRPDSMFVIDAETRADETQRLTFGSYRFIENGHCTREGLFYADDLPKRDLATLKRYAETHKADITHGRNNKLQLLTRNEFVKQFLDDVYWGRCLLVGFNLPFDLSRIAREFAVARGRFAGGFSLGLCSYRDKNGLEHSNNFRPRIRIKHIDSKRALKGFTARNKPDYDDLIPEDSEDGQPQLGFKFRGHFLDLRTLAFALTDQSYRLETACKAFGVEHGKQNITAHGVVSEEYIDYNRRDVLATAELAAKLLSEFEKHPISFSHESIFTGIYREGVSPGNGHHTHFGPPARFSQGIPWDAASAFFGGRTSAHIRKIPVPVVYVDFLSMYPTVNSLMDLWRFVIAKEIRVGENGRDKS